ncbi:MAG: HEPN domain-containing protein, partial [Candidatus Aenigmatarchaeota archaeon]
MKALSELDECIRKGLIRKSIPSIEKAKRSIKKAEKWLEEAKRNFKFGLFDSCLVSSYSAMFHAARSILFKDGFREKSHYCLARYLEENYANKGKIEKNLVRLLDRFREFRHQELYELEFFTSKEEAKEALEVAE